MSSECALSKIQASGCLECKGRTRSANAENLMNKGREERDGDKTQISFSLRGVVVPLGSIRNKLHSLGIEGRYLLDKGIDPRKGNPFEQSRVVFWGYGLSNFLLVHPCGRNA